MDETLRRFRIGRRRLLGLGGAASVTAIAGASVVGADDALPVRHIGFPSSDNQLGPAADVTVVAELAAPPGTTSITKDWASFIPYSGSKNVQSYGGFVGATTTGNGFGSVPFDLAAGSKILKIELTINSTIGLASSGTNVLVTRLELGSYEVLGTFTGPGGPGLVNLALTPAAPLTLAIGESLVVDLFLDTTRAFIAVTVHYIPPTLGLVTITPKRVYDSRGGPRITLDEQRLISVATGADGSPNVIPPGARAIAYNVTISDTLSNFGYLTVVPGGAPTAGPSSLNWDKSGATIANGLQVGLDTNRSVTVRCGGVPGAATHFIIDVVGYFL